MKSTLGLSLAFCLAIVAFVDATVHHNYIYDRANIFSADDYKKVFPNNEDEQSTLLHVHVLFRHGNRTADSKAELYPTDPYYNYTYFPYGLGQLTMAGKRREYSIGSSLRARYDQFLGRYYYPEIVEAISTDYNRTKMSLQLALAGLFPPKSDDMFAEGVFWQPIPFNYMPRPDDRLLLGVLCPRYLDLYNRYSVSNKIQNQFKTYKKVFDYISRNSGLNVTKFQDVYQLYFGISTETEYGLALPSWLNSVWPDVITNLAIEEYFVSMGTANLRKLATGYLLQKMLDEARARMGSKQKLTRKMFLYSAHENNVAQLLIAFGVFERHIPNYGAHVILEFHRINGVYGFKIFYENWTGNGPQLMKMQGCDTFCPFEKFHSLIDEHLPIDLSLCGN